MEREELSEASWLLVREWAEKVLSHKFPSVRHLARHLVDSTFVDARSVAAVTLLSAKAPPASDKGRCLLPSSPPAPLKVDDLSSDPACSPTLGLKKKNCSANVHYMHRLDFRRYGLNIMPRWMI